MNKRVSSDILNNSFDLLFPAIDRLKNFDGTLYSRVDDKTLKADLIAIATSVELLLKCKIASIDWTQLFQNQKKANKTTLLNGELKSVNFDCCLERIESISSIKFPDKTKKNIETIRKIRNKIAHFHFETKSDELISLISIGLDIYIEFYRSYIFTEFFEDKDRTKEIDNILKDVKNYVSTRVVTLKEKYKISDKPKTFYFSECQSCLQDVSIIQDKNTIKCTFCGHEEDIKWVAEIHSKYKGKTKQCPNCTLHSMTAIHSSATEEEAWDCVVCGHFINRPAKWVSQ